MYHNLEMVLHVLSGYNPRGASKATPKAASRPGFGGRFTRDFALANKSGDTLNPRFGIAPSWHSTIVDCVVAARYGRGFNKGSPAESPASAVRSAVPDGYLEDVVQRSNAQRYLDPQPAIIEPYDATQSKPNWGPDQARVIGQGPQDEHGNNQWLEDIHALTQADFDKRYGLKAPVNL